MKSALANMTLPELEKAVYAAGSIRRAATAMGVGATTIRDYLKKLRQGKAQHHVTHRTEAPGEFPRYFLLTSAQDGTAIHEGFWANLKAYASLLNAEIMVSGYTYGKSLFEDHSKGAAWFVPEIGPFMVNERVEIGRHLVFCGEMNTLPTAVNPLSGFQNYTGLKSGVFPHPKVQLESIPVLKNERPKMLYTTGSLTKANYIPKKAGIKAEFHHIIGALIVELLPDGDFFARQLLADEDGSFYDMDMLWKDGELHLGQSAEALHYGDIHLSKLNTQVAAGIWGDEFSRKWCGEISGIFGVEETPLYTRLAPNYQFFHDILDFEVRNHHNIRDPLFLYKQHQKQSTVKLEIQEVADFLDLMPTEGMCVIVESNHDLAFERWLKTADYRIDPANAEFFLECLLQLYKNVNDANFSILEWSVAQAMGDSPPHIAFLRVDESFKICDEDGRGIECGMHGHLGGNGAKGGLKGFAKIGPRCNVGHSHSAGIYEGVYQAGVSGNLEMGYNKGPSSWSHSHIVTYANGKRAIITQNLGGSYTSINL